MKYYTILAICIVLALSACNTHRPVPQKWSYTAAREVRYSTQVDTLTTDSNTIPYPRVPEAYCKTK